MTMKIEFFLSIAKMVSCSSSAAYRKEIVCDHNRDFWMVSLGYLEINLP